MPTRSTERAWSARGTTRTTPNVEFPSGQKYATDGNCYPVIYYVNAWQCDVIAYQSICRLASWSFAVAMAKRDFRPIETVYFELNIIFRFGECDNR